MTGSSSRRVRVAGLALALTAVMAAEAPARAAPDGPTPTIAFTRRTLPNGLVVVMHEDHAVPTVVVDIAYDVGSRHEVAGRTGFAHLFEHLMFMGTERAPTGAFDAWMESSGGWNNATTSHDRTNYYDVAPPTALPLLLWLEADRMRDLGPLMNQQKLDAQREVVRNERRQSSENRPYGRADLRLPELLYPVGHPYHHPIIGSHQDLEAAAVEEVKAFFTKHYDPANAVLVVAGDFEPASANALVDRYFGAIPSRGKPKDPGGPPSTPAFPGKVVRETMEDDVELPKLTIAWPSPKHFAPGDAELDLLAVALAGGKASRLYEKLVYQSKLAQSVEAVQASGTLGSSFTVEILARPGTSLDALEKALFAELEAVRTKPITEAELMRAKNTYETGFVAQLEAVRGRAALLAMYQTETGDPGYLAKDIGRYRAATPEAIRKVAEATLTPTSLVAMRVVPRAKPPEPKTPAPKAPKGGAK